MREGFHAGILMTVRGGLVVDEPHGERWDLALELLETGEDFVRLGSLRLYRAASGPWADGRLHVDVCSRYHRSQLTEQRARADIERGLRLLDVILADERFMHLVTDHGLVREYVDDYGTGTVRLAVIAPDGSPSWDAHPPTS